MGAAHFCYHSGGIKGLLLDSNTVLGYILDGLHPEIIVPGHGEVYDWARAESQRAYFKSLLDQVEQNFTPTIKNNKLIAKIDVSQYIDHRPRLGWIMAVNRMADELRKKK